MADRIQIRRDSDADWTSNNPTLQAGEPAYVSDTGEFMVGDGTTGAAALDRVKLDGPKGVLGNVEVTSAGSGISTLADVSGLSVTVDVDAGRKVKVSASLRANLSVSGDDCAVYLRESSTQLQEVGRMTAAANNHRFVASGFVVLTPSAGSHTYKVSAERVSGTGTITPEGNAVRPMTLVVEDIGPA